MKCFLVVNQLNDPCYIDYDEAFAVFVISKAMEKGLIEEDETRRDLDPNLVMQLFSPLVLSQWLLIDQTKEPCSSVHCPNGFCFVFHHVDDQLFICINGDGTESEEFLYKKIQVHVSLMRFVFGPVNELMSQSLGYTKGARAGFLRQLMHSWQDMAETEQSFLVEAIERMHVNQIMTEKCVEILKKSIKHLQAARESTTQHAILLAKSKLLALYSNRSANELMAKDLLSLMILSKTLHPNTDTLEDLFSKNYTGQGVSTSANETTDWGEEEYHSAPNTPKEGSPAFFNDFTRESDNGNIADSALDQNLLASLESLSAHSANEAETVKDALFAQVSQEKVPTLLQMYKEKYPNTTFNTMYADLKTKQHDKTHTEESSTTLPDSTDNATTKANEDVDDDDDRSCKTDITKNIKTSAQSEKASAVDETSDKETQDKSKDNNSTPTFDETQADTVVFQKFCTDEDYNESALFKQTSSLNSSPSTFGAASRSSSVLSEVGTAYPHLSPHLDENSDFQSFPTSPVSELLGMAPESPVYRDASVGTAIQDNSITPTTPTTPTTPVNEPQDRPMKTPARSFSTPTTETSTRTLNSDKPAASTSRSSSSSSNDIYMPNTVFLETSTCLYSPYRVDVLQVLPGLTLVLLSEVQHRPLADILYQVIHNIQDLLYGRRNKLPRSRSLNVYEIISTLFSKLQSSLRKYKGRISSLTSDICARWEKENVKLKLLDYLEKDVRSPIPPDLESAMTELLKKLKEVFSLLFLTPTPYPEHVRDALTQLKMVINAELMDYHDYLNVKVQRNITMTSYIDEFPGLIHFIFVDRHFHQMTAPSFNISLKAGESMDATSYLKNKIWTMYQHMMKKVMEGYSTVLLKDGDFYFSYFLWFEDYMGNPLPVQESLKPLRRRSTAGTLSGSFYLDLLQMCFPHAIKGSVHGFEMFLMHVGTVHPQFISSQCKRLAHKMWEMSGEAYTNLSLL